MKKKAKTVYRNVSTGYSGYKVFFNILCYAKYKKLFTLFYILFSLFHVKHCPPKRGAKMIITIIINAVAIVAYVMYIRRIFDREDETELIKSINRHREYIAKKRG